MEIFKIVAFSIISLVILLVLKDSKREDFALIITIVASVMILVFCVIKLEDIVVLLQNLINKAGINSDYLKILLKVAGISYIIELTSNICKDAGSSSLASKVEMAGKISIVALTIPILTSVISVVLEIL